MAKLSSTVTIGSRKNFTFKSLKLSSSDYEWIGNLNFGFEEVLIIGLRMKEESQLRFRGNSHHRVANGSRKNHFRVVDFVIGNNRLEKENQRDSIIGFTNHYLITSAKRTNRSCTLITNCGEYTYS